VDKWDQLQDRKSPILTGRVGPQPIPFGCELQYSRDTVVAVATKSEQTAA
jgi:hypothetical protein